MRTWRLAIAGIGLGIGLCVTVSMAAEPPSLFSSYDIVRLTLRAPINTLAPKGKQNADNAGVSGSVTIGDRTIDGVKVTTRGRSSGDVNECSFPKLKLRFNGGSSPRPAGWPASVKVGTHCGDLPDTQLTAKYGRLANPKEPHREALVYRLLDLMGVPTLKARPAEIAYATSEDEPLVRPAMLLEDDRDVRRRLDAIGEIDPAHFTSADMLFSRNDIANIMFGEAMIGNFDWCVKLTPTDRYRCDASKRLWNVLALKRADGTAVPVIYDFDLAGMVTGRHIWFGRIFNQNFVQPPSSIAVEVLSQLQRTRSVLSRDELDAVRRRFSGHKDAAFRAVGDSVVDADGARLAREYLTKFFAAIENDDSFYLPVVMKEGTRAYLDSAGLQPACGANSVMPVGTPVGESLDRRDNMVQVRVLDALWRWTGAARCDAVRNSPVWIDSGAVGRSYPEK